ncbi:TIGR03364 family FAD-dependent oxidoreductase [Subtercola endophyticus]|uniref:TIGR03364 family FAD-dependent oxidoreductase n=1 Tax=Subtercola endophyticus TaxID=2895559 RepID=UPI001E38256A|nr:TIGR03364 family FAD-dependent oxidoreductase [Subtercola endophyticus]UFS59984.1 TIGR03364 family FAD-dependent oxidoreductase [Subtercola endophyticus]
MNSANLLAECDVVIVGAGIVGLAHATEALRRGLSVVVIDRDSRAVGASVRNFGHCCVTAQSGDLLELAQSARERWLHYGALAGFFHVQSGGLAVARSAEELAVLDELSASRERGQVRLISAPEVLDQLGRSDDDHAHPAVLGGAVLRDDLRVDPRQAARSLAGWLDEQPGARVHWRTSFLGFDGTLAHTSRGSIRAQKVIVCVGHDLDYLLPDVADRFNVRRCSLQMALIEAPDARRITPAVLTGTSMLRYPAFSETQAATALRATLTAEAPELIDIDANVIFTQRPDGSIIAGDSHDYGESVDPFLIEATSDLLLANVRRVLGAPTARVLQRWQGIYASSPTQSYLIEHVDSRLTAVSITSGVGMTIGFGVAKRTLDSFG